MADTHPAQSRWENFTPRERAVIRDGLERGAASGDPAVRPWVLAAEALLDELESACGEAEDKAARDMNDEAENG